jgi:integrase
MFLGTDRFPTQVAVERHLEAFVLKLNSENPTQAILEPTFNALLDRFVEEEKLLEIKELRPGDRSGLVGELSYSTASSYLSVIKQIRAKWGSTRITRIKPVQVQEWLKKMDAAPKTKGHVKALMHRLYEKAMLWEMVEWQRNPMQLIEIKGISKRQKKPIVLTVEQFYQILELLPQPYRTMVVVAQCTGLRAEEVLALEWQDIDFENLSMRVVQAVVHGRVKIVKTEYSWAGNTSPKRKTGRLWRREKPHLWGQSWSSPVRSPGDTTTRPLFSRTISVRLDAVWWGVQTAGRASASGVSRIV